MTVTRKHLIPALTNALKEEIEHFKNSGVAETLVEEGFDPTEQVSCFLGQTDQQDLDSKPSSYRSKIGKAYMGLGEYKGTEMTPLETWSAYYWDIDKELVLKVLRYIKGEIDSLPEIEYKEIEVNSHE